MKRIIILFAGLFTLIQGLSLVPAAQAQTEIEFKNAHVQNQYPEGIVASIEVCGRPANSRVEFHYKNPAAFRFAWEKDIWTLDKGQATADCEKRQYFLETKDIDVPPFSTINYYWTVDDATGNIAKSPTYIYYYKDDSYQWRNIRKEKLNIWWHDRPDDFGQYVLAVAEAAMEHQQKFYSLSLEEPVTVVILNTFDEFFAWQSETDYSAGQSFPEIYLTVQVVEDENDFDWLEDVVPHEISHIYYDHLVKRISGAATWLDEGMATYSEYSDHSYEWNVLTTASKTGKIIPLEDLEGVFGEESEEIDIAYAESYYAILYMKEVYGEDAITKLLAEFQQGQDAATAFEKVFGKSPEDFDLDYVIWLKSRLKNPPPEFKFSGHKPTGLIDLLDNIGFEPIFRLIEILPLAILITLLWFILAPNRGERTLRRPKRK